MAGGESDEAALQKLRQLPFLEDQRRQLEEFERQVRGLVSRRPNFRHIPERGADGWFDAGLNTSIAGMKSTLYNLTEMLHFEISAVELRATMHKADAQLALQPDGVMQATLRKVEQLLDVTSIDAVVPSMQEWRVSHIEAESSRNTLAELLHLPPSCTWADGGLRPCACLLGGARAHRTRSLGWLVSPPSACSRVARVLFLSSMAVLTIAARPPPWFAVEGSTSKLITGAGNNVR